MNSLNFTNFGISRNPVEFQTTTFAMSRSGVRFPAAPPPAFERTGSHGFLWRNRRVFKGLGPYRTGNREPETRDFPILAANSPAVSGGRFFDHSFGDDANASARVYRSNPRNLRCSDQESGRSRTRLSRAAVRSTGWRMAAEDPDNRAIKDELARQRSLRAKIAKVIPD